MKTKILTIAAIFAMSIGTLAADNYRSFKMADRLGRTMEIFVKIENIQETFGFDTREVFNEIKNSEKQQMIDITPFVKQEREAEENLPVYISR